MNSKFKISFLLLFCNLSLFSQVKDTIDVFSPDKKIEVKIWMNHSLFYTISYNHKKLLDNSEIDFIPKNKPALSYKNKIENYTLKSVQREIVVPVPERRKKINDQSNELILNFKQPYQVIFKVYDDGIAYRIASKFTDSIYIENEKAHFCFAGSPSVYFPFIHKKTNADRFHTSFEENYSFLPLKQILDTAIAFTPVLIVPPQNPKIAITESDLLDYPGMFLEGTGTDSFEGVFAPFPLEEKSTNEFYSQKIVTKRANYIAYTKGTRQFPWRVIMIAPEDKSLPMNDMVYKLASESKLNDVSWVHSGKCTDEWIINTNLFNVPFKSGINTSTYKYYIDFAKNFGFDRIMMDAGWSDNNDLFKINSEINMDSISAYAREKNIRLSMWTLAETLDKQLEPALDQFQKWGVDFIMTDFIDRDDQKTVQFYERVAKACAEHKIMIMYHGAYSPKGFNRTYPNAITREGVLGSEYNIWSDKVTPSHDLILPFTRMLAGSFDYEPGFLNNATKNQFRSIEGIPMSFGTRCHQLAMFVVYDSPIQIFSGNPSQGYLQPDFMQLLGSIPTGWDNTIVLEAKVENYIITARKKGNDWYIGGMTNWTSRNFNISFDFLDDGKYSATICKDGVNADKYASDYSISAFEVERKSNISVHLAPGGGFLIRLIKNK